MGLKVQDPSSPGKPSLTWSTRGLEPAARSPPWSADYWKSRERRNSARTILTVGSRSRLLVPDPTCCCFILMIPFLLSCCWRDAETCWLLNHSISYLRRPHLFSEVFLMEATEVCSMMSPVLVLTVPTTRGRPGQKHRPLPGISTYQDSLLQVGHKHTGRFLKDSRSKGAPEEQKNLELHHRQSEPMKPPGRGRNVFMDLQQSSCRGSTPRIY